MDPSGFFEADQASGQSSQTKDSIGMKPGCYNTAEENEIEDIPHTPNLPSPIEISEDSKSESGEPAQAEVNIGMEPVYYNAAEKGEFRCFQRIEGINQLLTPNRNTVLHIYLTSLGVSESGWKKAKNAVMICSGRGVKSEDLEPENSELSTAFVEKILERCPPLLQQANGKGETPLHIAARYGHAAIVNVLIKRTGERALQEDPETGAKYAVQKMLEMTNNEEDTALHEAVRGGHLKVVKRLIEEGKDFSYSQNNAGETPLYMAVERGFEEVAYHILETCTSPAHDGPRGRTTLHAAVIVGNKGVLLKEVGGSIAYMKDAEGMTALHIAAHRGYPAVMVDILKYCPDCCELVDKRGWNALHFVVNSSSSRWAEYGVKNILKKSSICNLFNEKDADGNTPLHHHSKSLHYIKDLMCHSRVDKMAYNKDNLNADDIALTSEELSDKKFKQIARAFIDNGLRAEFRRPLEDVILPKRKDNERKKAEVEAHRAEVEARNAAWKARKDRFVFIMEKASNSHLVVDTLIATVAFTAGITMPGGFIGQEGPHLGSPALIRNTAFKVFIITNTVAMVQSCSAAFIHLFMPLLFDEQNLGDFSFLLASLAFCLSISAMGAMVLAFVMGTYAVLLDSSGLAIANSVVGLFFFIPVFFVSIGSFNFLLEILREGSTWILDRLCDCKFLCIAFDCIVFGWDRIAAIFNRRRRKSFSSFPIVCEPV